MQYWGIFLNGFGFLTKCLINYFAFLIEKRVSERRMLNWYSSQFWPFILVMKVHILAKNSGTSCFPLRPRVFYRIPCFPPDPAFSTAREPVPRDPAPRDPGLAFST